MFLITDDMTQKYLIDTSIWVDLYEDRRGFKNEPLGDYALNLLIKIKAKDSRVVLTDLLMRELEVNYSIGEINGMFKPFEKQVEKIIVTKKQMEEAERIASKRDIPPGDVLHAIIARDNALILITRDKHFKQIEDIAKHYRPEDIT